MTLQGAHYGSNDDEHICFGSDIQVRNDDTCENIPTDLMMHPSYVTRLIGTFIGLCFGLATWYIGENDLISRYFVMLT
jgi:hypothetical protein